MRPFGRRLTAEEKEQAQRDRKAYLAARSPEEGKIDAYKDKLVKLRDCRDPAIMDLILGINI